MSLKSFLLFTLFITVLNAEMTTRTKVMMGTFASITLPQEHKHLFKRSFEILKRVDNSLSSYNKNSPIYKLNKNRKSDINLYTYEALSLSKGYYKNTAGYFNIAIGSITQDLYHFGASERVPESWELNASDVSFSEVVFERGSASLGQGVQVDLGGMGKGFGVDRVVEYLKINGVTEARVALSGDIRCLGVCKVEIVNPSAKEPLKSFYTKYLDMGVSTSGNYNRYVKDVKNNHLINPKTKESQTSFISITLIAKLPSSDLDAYATAASVMPSELAFKFLDSLELAYVVLDTQKLLTVSENFELFTSDGVEQEPEYIEQ